MVLREIRENVVQLRTARSSPSVRVSELPLPRVHDLRRQRPRLLEVPDQIDDARCPLSGQPCVSSGFGGVEYGGPDRPARRLRDLLEERIDAVDPGGSINWMTYYFRDERLADALIRAHHRGVKVRLCLEGRPRNSRVNAEVIRRLADPVTGIGQSLRVVQHILPLHLHTKIYCFSDPQPTAYIGSFNPSGNEPEETKIIGDIGDQDRGHNLLVKITDPDILAELNDRVAMMHRNPALGPARARNPVVHAGGMELVFFPLVGRNPLMDRLEALEAGSVLRIAASHVRDSDVARMLARLVRRGVHVQLLTGGTTRRTPGRMIRRLISSGVDVFRFSHPEQLPMHAKFMLAESPSGSWAAFGSYNLTKTSRWLNQELLAFSSDPQLLKSLNQRWAGIIQDSATVREPWLGSPSILKIYRYAFASWST